MIEVASLEDVPVGEARGFRVRDREIAVYRLSENEVRASDNRCTHEYACLSDGLIDGRTIECPLHGGRFDLDSGAALGPPVERDVEMFEALIVGGKICVKL
jgi:nitrite reductase/ring-hydroxylating ferredoxin subunit